MRKNGKDSVHTIFACVGVCLPYLSEASSMTLVALKSQSESEVAQSCPTLCNPMDSTLPHSSVHGIFQARVLEWGAISFSRGSSWSRDWTRVSRTVGRRFTIRATREESSKYFFPVGKGENVILLGYPVFPHRTAASVFTHGDILLACVWTVFQAASFAQLALCALAGPGAAPTRQVSHPFIAAVCRAAWSSQLSRPWLHSPLQYHMWVDYFGFKIIPIKIIPINATSMAEESKKFWRVNCIFYILLFKVLGRNSVDLIQPPLSRRNRRPIYLCYLLWQN